MEQRAIRITEVGAAGRIAAAIRTARALARWSQRELAERAGTSQSMVCRLESGRAPAINMLELGKVLGALGLDARLVVEGRHLFDRVRQDDAVHAKVTGYVGRRIARNGWLTSGEAMIGDRRPRGWIDLLAYRDVDRALLVEETKTDIPDMGALQRSLAFYEREAMAVARGQGWQPRTVNVLVVALDSETIAHRLADNRDIVRLAFPAPVPALAAWLKDPAAPRPHGWTIATCDPASRRADWLRPTTLGSRRTAPAYANYADAASRLLLPVR